jgi:DNA-binding GntR family transcriptional regulator
MLHTVGYRQKMPSDPRRYMQLYELLSARIADGTLRPGDRLNIGTLADEHDMSRPTVAHALRMLEADGKVSRYPGVGWTVN